MSSVTDQVSSLPSWVVTIGASAASAVGAVVLATVNQAPNFQRVLQASTKTLIDGYEARVANLSDEVDTLRAEIISLRKTIFELASRSPSPKDCDNCPKILPLSPLPPYQSA